MLGAVEQDIRRLHVAVDEPTRMSRVERRGDLSADGDGAGRLERALGSKERSEVGAVHEPHREIQAAVDVARVVDRDTFGCSSDMTSSVSRAKRSRNRSSSAREGATSFSATGRFKRRS